MAGLSYLMPAIVVCRFEMRHIESMWPISSPQNGSRYWCYGT